MSARRPPPRALVSLYLLLMVVSGARPQPALQSNPYPAPQTHAPEQSPTPAAPQPAPRPQAPISIGQLTVVCGEGRRPRLVAPGQGEWTPDSRVTLDEALTKWSSHDRLSQGRQSQERQSQDQPSQDDPSQEYLSQDNPSQEHPAQDKPSQEHPSQGNSSHDQPSQERPSQDRQSQDRQSQDRQSQDRPSQDHQSEDRPSEDLQGEQPPAVGEDWAPAYLRAVRQGCQRTPEHSESWGITAVAGHPDSLHPGSFNFDLRSLGAPWRRGRYLQLVFSPASEGRGNGSDGAALHGNGTTLHGNGSDGAALHSNRSDGAALLSNGSDGAALHGNGAALHGNGSDGAALHGNVSNVTCTFTVCGEDGVCANLTRRAVVTGTWGHSVPEPWSPESRPSQRALGVGVVALSAASCDQTPLTLARGDLRPLIVFFPSARLARLSNALAARGWRHLPPPARPARRPHRRSAAPTPPAPPPGGRVAGLGCRRRAWAVTAAELGFVKSRLVEPAGVLDIGYCAGPCVHVTGHIPADLPEHAKLRTLYLRNALQRGAPALGVRTADCVATGLVQQSIILRSGDPGAYKYEILNLQQIRVVDCQCR